MNRRDAIRAVMAMPGIAEISVATLKPDDVIVLEFDGFMSSETAERIKAHMDSVWPGRKVVVIDQGLKMKIVRGSKE